MDSVYKNIPSYPHQRDQLHYNPYPYPVTEPIPPQAYAHHGRPPWCSNYGYVPPIAGHGCCGHYPFVSPYSHHFPVGCHPYPIPYMPPSPSCYPTGHVPAMGGPHCCGCPNHLSHPVEQRDVRIEEEGLADGGRRKSDSLSPLVWMPPDYGSDKDDKDRQEGDGKGGFPLPLFWIPYKSDGKEMEKPGLNCLSIKPSQDHVKEVGKHEENEGSKNDQEKGSNIPLKENEGEKKISKEKSVEKESPSPPKSSKLPPVCLRVDPLPRKKPANGSMEKHDSQSGGGKCKILNPSGSKKQDKIPTNEVKEGKGTKTIQVVDGKTLQERNMGVNVESLVKQPEEVAKVEDVSRECLGTVEELSRGNDGRRDEVEMCKRKLSDDEAVVVIQKVYRGFETRRWDPVKKLKEIAKVREEMDNVKCMIQAVESSSDAEGRCRQGNAISETIMSLLLKLDTIQGLHPSVREVRKCVVKELVSLQEKLDSLMSEKPVNSLQQGSLEDASIKIEDVKLSEGGSSETPCDSPKADQIQLDEAHGCDNLEISRANPNREKSKDVPEKEDEKSNEGLENDVVSRESCDEGLIPNTWESHNAEIHHCPLGKVNAGLDEVNTKNGDGQSEPAIHALDLTLGKVDDGSDEVDTKNGGDQSEPKEFHHVLDLPLGEVNVGLNDVDTKKGDDQYEPEELHQVLDLPLGKVNVGSDVVDTKNGEDQSEPEELHQVLDVALSKVDDGLDEVDIKIVDDQSEPKERIDQQPQDSKTGIVEPSLAEQDMHGQLLHECTTMGMETHEAVAENANGDEENDEMQHVLEGFPLGEVNVGLEKVDIKTGDGKSETEECVEQPHDSIAGIVEPSLADHDMSGQLLREGTEENQEAVDHGLMESNRKLVEENERLRGIMENLMRLGQEQVEAISRLTGRVKDLERRTLSKKSKLKVRRGSKARAQ